MGSENVLPRPGSPERRRWPRFRVDVPLQIVTQPPAKVILADGRGRNLNRGGMSVSAAIELSIDQQVTIQFTPPDSSPIRLRSFVRSRDGGNCGVEFITENDADYRAVHELETILRSMG